MGAGHSHGHSGHSHSYPHPHSSGHGHGHAHAHGQARNRKRLLITLSLTFTYMVAEVVGGLITGSLALLADAGHMFSDAGALALSTFALWMAQKPATPQRTYGYYRMEILAALANGAALIAIAAFILFEAYHRLAAPPHVQGSLLMAIAFGGLCINGISLWVLHQGTEESLNVRGAYLHVLTDALGSIGALLAGAAIWFLGWYWADPAISAVIALLVVYSSWDLLRQAVSVLMEGTPRGISVDQVRDSMVAVAGVEAVHDLHVWTISSGLDSLSAHVVVENEAEHYEVLAAVRKLVHERYGIHHVTIQIEPPDFEEHRVKF